MMFTKKEHPKKGDFGYYRYEKKRRTAIVLFLFAVCLLVYFTGLIRTGTKKNMFTLVAILGVLPAAKWAVSMIMVCLQKNAGREVFDITESYAKDLVHGYELCITAYEGRLSLDAVVVCGNVIAAYSSAEKGKFEFMETHLKKIIHTNHLGNPAVKIFRSLDKYGDRIKQIASNPDSYREGLSYTPDEQHEGESRDEAVLRVIKAIAI